MKKHIYRCLCLAMGIIAFHAAMAQNGQDDQNDQRDQNEWPKSITTPEGTIVRVFQPQVESFAGINMRSRSAISVQESGASPVFGVCWSTATVGTNRDTRQVDIESVKVDHIKMAADSDLVERDHLKTVLETDLPKVAPVISLDEVLASLDQSQQNTQLSQDISNKLPDLIFRTTPSMLVLIDGKPVLRQNPRWGMNVVVNTPFTVINYKNQFYLYGGGHWYSAPAATGPYTYTHDKVQHKLKKAAKELEKAAKKNGDQIPPDEPVQKMVYNIVVSTKPAELVQTDGNPDLVPIEGTSLLYVKNSDNDILVDTHTQQYYVLLSGRWYTAPGLDENSPWHYVNPTDLPADFSKIPEGSPKDEVLASVPGTPEAREAVMDAEIPQTAKVDRRSAMTHVQYDGAPQFKPIKGTDMQYAVNTSSTVIEENNHYFAVDNGVWFTSDNPDGPWVVSNTRPQDMDRVPPDCPVYDAKYVYVYESDPDYVYDGYTPGYLNSFIDGPVVVYGTGYDYDPWLGDYYYPRPWTWGFGMCYNPWTGWGFGDYYDWDWFDDGFGWGWGWDWFDDGFGWGGWWGGGWWGLATAYRPAYRNWHGGRFHWDHRGGYYGPASVIDRQTHMHMRFNNDVYRGRQGVMPRQQVNGGVLAGEPLRGAEGGRVFTDRQGNIYRHTPQGWQQRVNGNWGSPVNRGSIGRLEQQRQMNVRGAIRARNFNRASQFGGMRFSHGSFGGGHFEGGGHFGGGGGHFGGGRH